MIGLVRHDGEVTWMSEECFKTLNKVYKQYVAVVRCKGDDHHYVDKRNKQLEFLANQAQELNMGY